MLSASFGASKLSLPTTACTLPALSLRNSTLPALYSLTVLADVGRHRAGAGRRHQAARAEHFAQRADELHHVRRGDADVEVGPAALDLLGQVLLADVRRRRPPWPPRPWRPWRTRPRAAACRCRAAARSSRGRSGRPAWGRRPAGSRSRPSGRTSCRRTPSASSTASATGSGVGRALRGQRPESFGLFCHVCQLSAVGCQCRICTDADKLRQLICILLNLPPPTPCCAPCRRSCRTA